MWKGIEFTGQLRKQVGAGGCGSCGSGAGRGWGAVLRAPLPSAPRVSGERWFIKMFQFSGFLAVFVGVCALVHTFLPSLGLAAE